MHDTTGYTPSMLTHGREITMPVVLVCWRPNEEPIEYCRCVANLRDRLDSVHEFARSQAQLTHDRARRHCDLRADRNQFDVGDPVWVNNLQRKKGMCPKLAKQWEGPYYVADQVNDVLYRVQRGPPKLAHKDRGSTVDARWAAITRDNRRCPGSGQDNVKRTCEGTVAVDEQWVRSRFVCLIPITRGSCNNIYIYIYYMAQDIYIYIYIYIYI